MNQETAMETHLMSFFSPLAASFKRWKENLAKGAKSLMNTQICLQQHNSI